MLDIEHRLGLTSEEALLRAYEDVAYHDASVLLGGTAFTAGAAKLGINLTRLRPTAALNALRAGRTRLDDMIGNTYDPGKLRQVTAEKSEWSERLKRNFEHVLISRQLNALVYEEKVDIEFASDDELYAYLQRLFAYLFEDGPVPEWN